MRFAKLICLLAIAAGTANAQVNPHTNIRWPDNCYAHGMVYNWRDDTCIPITVPVGPISDKGGQVYNVQAYGAVGDAQSRADCSITAGSSTLTCSGANFNSHMNLAVVAMGPKAIPIGSYVSGGTFTGNIRDSCTVTFASPSGGVAASATLFLTGTNAVAGGEHLYFKPNTMGSGYTSAPTLATLSNGTATCSGSVIVSTTLFPLPVMSSATYVSATTMTLATVATTSVSTGKATVATDDTAAIQSAITAACANDGNVFFPPAYYGIQGVTIGCPIRFSGANINATENDGGENLTVPPYLVGSVLQMMKPNTDAVRTTVNGHGVNFDRLGIVFDPTLAFWQSGHGFNGYAVDPFWGIQNAYWDNLFVWGTDGNHYAFTLINSVLWNSNNLYAYGGGGLQLNSTLSAGCCSGNAGIGNIYISLLAGGTSSGVSVTALGTQAENLIHFWGRMQVNQNDPAGSFPGWPIPYSHPTGPNEPELVYIPSNIESVTILNSDIEPLVVTGQPLGGITLPYSQSFRLLNPTPSSRPSYIPVVGTNPVVTNLVGDFMTTNLGGSPVFTNFDGTIMAMGGIKHSSGFQGIGFLAADGFSSGIGMVNGGGTLYTGRLTNLGATIWEQLSGSSANFSVPLNASSFSVGGVAGFTGTKTAGSCVLTISGGIITNVTGC